MEDLISDSSVNTEEIGINFAKKLRGGDVVFLVGELGVGKTTFAKGLAKGLGVRSRIISPTFTIVREHRSYGNSDIKMLYHLDLYRIEDRTQVKNIDIKDLLTDKNGVVVIEWPKFKQDIVKKKIWKVAFSYLDNDKRKISISNE